MIQGSQSFEKPAYSCFGLDVVRALVHSFLLYSPPPSGTSGSSSVLLGGSEECFVLLQFTAPPPDVHQIQREVSPGDSGFTSEAGGNLGLFSSTPHPPPTPRESPSQGKSVLPHLWQDMAGSFPGVLCLIGLFNFLL